MPTLLLPAPESAPDIQAPAAAAAPEQPAKAMSKDNDKNWLLKGVQTQQAQEKAAADQLQTNAATAEAAGRLREPGKSIDPLAPVTPGDAATKTNAASKTGYKPLITGLNSDTSKPLQEKDGQAKAALKKESAAPKGINPDLIRPIDFGELEKPSMAANDITAPSPSAAGTRTLGSVAIKVPEGSIANPALPAIPALAGSAAPTAPAVPQAPTARTLSGTTLTTPRPIAMPAPVKPITRPAAPALPSIPSQPRLADPNDEWFHRR